MATSMRVLATGLALSTACGYVLIFGQASARAVSCYGDYCSGRDPLATGCSADGRSVAHVQLPWVQQRLELRWSPRCKTNWARMLYDPNPSWLRAVQPSTNYTQQLIGRDGTNSWSAMIYSPSRCVYAEVQTAVWGRYKTACV